MESIRIDREPAPRADAAAQRGLALLAVLFALTLLMLLALPFAVSMSVGAEAAMRDVDQTATEQASASVRELLLADAALSHPAIDPTPDFDGLDEFPAGVSLPAAFSGLRDEGRVLLGGELTDLQRYLSLDAASPLVLANALGTATRLSEDLEPEATAMVVDDASALPEEGYLWLANEVVRYAQKEGNHLLGLERGLLREHGFADGTEGVAAQALVLDYRCVLAAIWPFFRPDANGRRLPYRSVGELLAIEQASMGSFTSDEIDAFERVFSVSVRAETAPTWGRPERVFNDLLAGETRTLMVRSALHLGSGSTVRIRNVATGEVEYGMLMAASTQRAGQAVLQLPSVFQLQLLMPVRQGFPAVDTVVEPLVPPPVNINTAPADVLQVLFANVRRSGNLRITHDNNRRSTAPPNVTPRMARELAAEIEALRGGQPVDGVLAGAGGGPFTGWRDLVDRVFRPRLEQENNNTGKNRWIDLYRCLRTGRDSVLEMGTAPICFRSGPWFAYRAAASRQRSLVAQGVTGRHERSGLAAALPGFRVEQAWTTQRQFEDAFVLDRRSPYWITGPINLGHLQPGSVGNDPAGRYFPHLIPVAWPSLGLGTPRYAVSDEADSGITPATAMVRPNAWPGQRGVRAFESFAQGAYLRGRDVRKEGPYQMNNTGPMETGGTPQQGGNRRHDRISFPFSKDGGFMGRFATAFWCEPQSIDGKILFEHGDGNPDQNRLVVLGRDGNLTMEVLDEAGIDPNPGDSPAGVQRTAAQVNLPLAELALPADTPLHLSFSAPSGRPADLSFFVDGMTRGKPKFVTYLTAPIPPFDPSLSNNAVGYGQDPNAQSGNERFLDIQVESTDGFPPVGVLRIGLELFEYTAINGNTFSCRFVDSLGGRGARQIGREHRPAIPTDPNTGRPTVDINDPQFQGLNLDVFPEHPVGALVELYGYSALVSEDTAMMPGATSLDGQVGAFAVARGFIDNPDSISIIRQNGPPLPVGRGISETWQGDLLLADPVPTGDNQPPDAASNAIADAFPTGGGYVLVLQERIGFEENTPGQISGTPAEVGGIEVMKYTSRNGNKLTGLQRAQTLPGQNNLIGSDLYDGQARKFVTDFNDDWRLANNQGTWDDIPSLIVWVVPISLPVQNTGVLWDPDTTGLTEWVQLRPRGGNDADLEWVRYDGIADGRHLVRKNRAAWRNLFNELTRTTTRRRVQVGPLGPNAPNSPTTPPWGTITATANFVGYTPQIESTFPQIHYARRRLAFRGDPFTGTSSHPQQNAQVTQCQRLQLLWGNYGAYTGRVGRHDRVALVGGQTSNASGTNRPNVEWHTVTWQARRYGADNLQNATPAERLGPWPFQLVAFKDAVQVPYLGPPANTVVDDPRRFDRLVKFPSGELPAAFCANPTVGGGVNNDVPIAGIVDEVEVVQHFTGDLVVDQIMTDSALVLTTNPFFTNNSAGAVWSGGNDLSAAYPASGGLIQVDDEIMAYTAVAQGVFQISPNGRGLLNTRARGHDRGARVKFLVHRPAAILAGGVGAAESVLTMQALGPLPSAGTLLLGQELLHYCWSRRNANTVEMPNWYAPNPDGTVETQSGARGLFRGRYGTRPQGASAGDVAILWPIRHWDRYAEFSDDPELGYFQMTTNEAPVFFRDLTWREEVRDPRVEVLCMVRTDSLVPWSADPAERPGLWHFRGGSANSAPHRIDRMASRLEIRFQTIYQPGAIDLAAFSSHGWKTSARVENVRLQYEGQSRVLAERVTVR